MKPVAPTPEQVCGRCQKFEPSSADPKYGYCESSLAHERERSRVGVAHARLVDVAHPCFMVLSPANVPAFVAKRGVA
jgi:hypothetical protein